MWQLLPLTVNKTKTDNIFDMNSYKKSLVWKAFRKNNYTKEELKIRLQVDNFDIEDIRSYKNIHLS